MKHKILFHKRQKILFTHFQFQCMFALGMNIILNEPFLDKIEMKSEKAALSSVYSEV